MKNIYPLNSRFTLPFAFVLAVSLLAVSLMFMLPGGLLHAQTGPIEYPENGTGPVATFTAVDPEGVSIKWSLLDDAAGDQDIDGDGDDDVAPEDIIDLGNFSISPDVGVLTFNNSPDYEIPADDGGDNVYSVVVQASVDGPSTVVAWQIVTIEVTDVEESGTVTLSTLQPQVGVMITAILTDPDAVEGANSPGTIAAADATWQWYRGANEIVGATEATYTPGAGDVGSILRATAMYDDPEGEDKTAQEASAHAVREAPASNVPPSFPTIGTTDSTNQAREVAENTPAGRNVGAPVTASDPDVLTYSLDDTGAMSFDINRATGQLITKVALDHEIVPTQYTVMVEATDPFGAAVVAQVTITVTDVNEVPSVTGAASIDHAESNDGTVVALNPNEYTVADEDVVDVPADLMWTLSGADASKFDISTTGATRTLAFKANPDYEAPGDSGRNNVYEVTVVVTDTQDNTDEQDVTVKVANIEEIGTITFSTLQPRVGFPVTANLSDPDNITAGSVSWQWYRAADITINLGNLENFNPADANNLPQIECEDDTTAACSIKGATSAVYVPVAGDVNASLTAVATYTDGNGDGKDYAAAGSANNVLVNTINEAPVFPDQDDEMEGRQTAQERTVDENTVAETPIGDSVGATDEDMILTYSLGGLDAASFDIVRISGQLQTKAELDKETKDTYTVTVTATDSLGASSTITVTIKVNNVDEMPDLEGEAPEEYAENGTRPVVTFTAVDPEGELIVWSLAAGDDMEDFSIENGVLRFKSPPDYEMAADADSQNDYVVTVQASDGGDDTTAMKTVTLEVTNVEEPGTVMLSTLQPQVGVVIMATLDDPDNETANTVMWQWSRGSSPISGATESDYIPMTGDIGNVLRATAMYDDGEDDDKTAQEVSYRSVRRAPGTNTDPVFPDQDLIMENVQTAQTRTVAENTPVGTNLGAPIAASDPGDVLTYSLGGTNAASFSITRATGQLSTKTALDSEDMGNPTDNEFVVIVTATDPFGKTAMSQVTITVTDVNEAPTVIGDASIDHAENGIALAADPAEYTASDPENDDLKWSLSGADASKFNISETGAMRTLAFKANPDYESPGDSGGNNVYEVTVKVTDSKGNSDEQDVTVKVTNMEETGTVTLSTLQPRVGFSVTATLADPDNITAGSVSWQWYREATISISITDANVPTSLPQNECDDTTINSCSIKGATSAAYVPMDADVGNSLTAVATYTDGNGDGKDYAATATDPANDVLADTRNKAPVFPDQDDEMEGRQTAQERTVAENTASAMIVGLPVVATDSIIDPNTGNTTPEALTYSLGGDDADSFSIDRASGQLSTKAALDKETKDTYTVTVTATDPSGETATVTVTIKVTNVDEMPTIMLGGLTISGMSNVDYAEKGAGAVATYTAVGPESASTTWSVSGDDAGDFNITTGGELRFNASPDYDAPRDEDTNNVYKVTVEAYDGTYMATPHQVTVTVTDDGVVVTTILGPSNMEYVENDTGSVATYMLSANAASAAWTLEGPDADDFTIDSGVLVFKLPPDYERKATYIITVKADGATYDVTITVTDVDEALTAISGPSDVDYAENDTDDVATFAAMDPDGTAISWTLEGTDADVFDISNGGVLTFKSPPDYETKTNYMVTVKATAGTDMATPHQVTVTVTDVNEALTAISGPSDVDYAENDTDDVATFAAMDPEGETISWTLEGTDADVFDISSGGVLTFRSPPDYETKTTYMVTVKASAGTDMGRLDVTVMVTDVNEALTAISGPSDVDYAENDTDDVATFAAMDPDGTAISWTLEGTDADVFDISNGGVLTFKSPPDYETKTTYMITVNASAGTDMGSLDVTVTVTDVNEALTAISGPSDVGYAENGTDDVATFAAMDPEGETISWTLEGTDADVFDISSGGVLTFRSPPDYETKTTYMVTVKASAGTDMGRLDVTVMVTDVDEMAPEMSLLEMYDTDGNDQIDRAELKEAIIHYIEGDIERDQLRTLIMLFITG